ncbi:MAG: hypothetical protein RR902_03735 [Oscillospiraceae bacterium]
MKNENKKISKLLLKLCLFLLPVVLYFIIFLIFEPYNYFNLRTKNVNTNQPIYRVRHFTSEPTNAILLGDSRTAHLDTKLVNEITHKDFTNLAFGGAAQKEASDLFWYAIDENPSVDTVYLQVSFYTLNINYQKDRIANIKKTANNPFAYCLNFNYNLEMLSNMLASLKGTPNDFTAVETAIYTNDDYLDENGEKLSYRRQLLEYIKTIYPNLSTFNVSDIPLSQLEKLLTNPTMKNYRKWEINNSELARLLEISDYCQKNNIKLTFVLPPIDDTIMQLCLVPLGIDKEMQSVINTLKKSGATVLDFEINNRPDFDETQFYDGFHLDTVRGLPPYTQLLFGNNNTVN